MKHLSVLIILMACAQLRAQSYIKDSAEPHSYDAKTTELVYLFTKSGMGIEASFCNVDKRGLINQYSLSYDKGEFTDTKTKYSIYAAYFGKIKILYNSDSKSFFVNLGANAYVSCERIKNDILNECKTQFSPGIMARVELEYYMGKVGFTVNAQQLYKPLSEIGDWQWRVGAGLKYIIN
ncbi:hypothetical protein SAMN06265379_11245 [Saccharicrinis carchari]|uniref:Uncharacterized protein n=1 Tax=Saccharicrinis carchari TaxID=1168039 RepID=A0A521EZW1_SACCC|nr:conjugal transfer protein TraO [Saccharicrinis carchari]SMO89484.1 hypothetical protein SAMN06265379_11245 [Saccharicrinis carchari]